MLLDNKNKIFSVVIFFIIVLGFSAGLNYQTKLGDDTINVASKCFDFGIYDFFCGNSYLKIFFSICLSLFKHFAVIILGKMFFVCLPVIPLDLFGISFKFGIVISFVVSYMKGKGVFSIAFIGILCIYILSLFFVFSIFLMRSRMDSFKKYFTIKNTSVVIGIFFLVSLLQLFLFYFSEISGLNLYGFFRTFL